jgi:hypothetical protein
MVNMGSGKVLHHSHLQGWRQLQQWWPDVDSDAGYMKRRSGRPAFPGAARAVIRRTACLDRRHEVTVATHELTRQAVDR